MRTAVTKEQAAYMKARQKENRSKTSPAEEWAERRLRQTGLKWTRQAVWGCRLFDFWCGHLGVAVEVDGPEHNPAYDAVRDGHNLNRSAIIVLRVANFDDQRMDEIIATLPTLQTWGERRRATAAARSKAPKAHGRWKPKPLA